MRTGIPSRRVLAVAIFGVVVFIPQPLWAQDSGKSETNSLISRIQDNIDRFEFMTCDYNYTKAKAKTSVDAYNGNWMPRQTSP